MALNVSNELMLLVQKIRKKQLLHITTLTMSHRVDLCVKS